MSIKVGGQLNNVTSGGATTTNGANIADVQAAQTAAQAASVPLAGHGANTLVGNATAGTASAADVAVAADSVPGRSGSGNIGNISMTAAGRAMAGAASATAQTALLDLATPGAKGLGPVRTGAAGSYLDVTGAYTIPSGTGTGTISSLTGDVTGSGSGAVATTIAHVPFTPLQTALAAASAALNFNNQQLTGIADPTTTQGAATKGYVDALIAGLKWKQSVLCASTTNVVLATGAQNGSVIDSVSLTTGVRFALKDQTAPSENGIYTANASGAPTRAVDANTGAELVSCAFFVQQGTLNADKAFVCSNDSITIGVTGITFVPFASVVGALIAANNLSDLTNAATARTNLGLAAIAASGSATDLTSGTVNVARLPASGVAPGTYGDATHVSTVTVDTLGRITTAVATAILITASQVTGLAAIAISGSATDLGTGTIPAARLPASGVTAGTYGDATHSVTVVVDATGRITGLTSVAISIAAGAVSGLSAVQTGALTGDVTKPAGSGTTTLANIPNDAPMVGDLLATAIAAPSTPAAGHGKFYLDITSKALAVKNDAGIVSHTVQSITAVASNFLTAIDNDGTPHAAQPGFGDLTGSLQAAQFPALSGDVTSSGGSFSTAFGVVAAQTILANPSAFSGRPSAQSVATVRTMLGLDAPQSFDVLLSFGTGDGTNGDSLTPQSAGPGNWPFFLLPNTRNSDIPNNGYSGGNHDANLATPATVNEWRVTGAFGHVELSVEVAAVSGIGGGASVVFILSKNGLLDASPCSVTITTTGFFSSGVISLGGFAFTGADRVGVRAQVLGGSVGAQLKATVTVHLTP